MKDRTYPTWLALPHMAPMYEVVSLRTYFLSILRTMYRPDYFAATKKMRGKRENFSQGKKNREITY